jgi:hypothetical protein
LLSSDDAGGAIATWSDGRSAGNAAFPTRGRPLGASPLLHSAEANAERARLTWQVPAGTRLSATVMRASDGSEWRAVGETNADAQGALTYEDRNVTPGARYQYRLAVARGEEVELMAEASLLIPKVVPLALLGTRPSPAHGALRVALALPSSQRALLELLDVAGRRIAAREVGGLGPGDHVVELEEGTRLSPGIYLLRLSQGKNRAMARAAIVR